MGNVFPPFRFNSAVKHLSEMVLFTRGSGEMAEQKGCLFLYTSCYLCSLRNVAEFNGCITRPYACARLREREGERDARPRNAARGGNHLLLQVKCFLKWASQYGGSTQEAS